MMLRDGLHLVDAPDHLTAERERSFHVTAEVQVHRGAELVHRDVILVLQSLAALGAQRAQARPGEPVQEDGVGLRGTDDRVLPVLVHG